MLRLVRRGYAETVGALTLIVVVVAVAWFAIGGYLGYILIGRPSDRTRHLWPFTVLPVPLCAPAPVVAGTRGR
ncbi:MAG: hypothetical protein WBL06_00040 [Pseudolysinimonas sp.]|jgi:hypothetical protein|uniref:hypothetical protein n=1 Tax=Pseudolysinimonas sp. TaxID=2680009 RepID=UPI003C762ACC